MSKILLIGLSWEQLPLLEQARRQGHEVVATGSDSPFLRRAEKYYAIDSRDLPSLDNIFRTEQPDALLADECDYSMYAVAYLAEKYNKPGPALATLTVTTNKYLQRLHARRACILQPRFELCWNLSEAKEAAAILDFPVMIKPVDNRGSIGVRSAFSEKELEDAWYHAVAHSHSRMCLVEEFISGDVVTVEGFHDSHELHLIVISTKEHYPETPNVAKVLFYPGMRHDNFPYDEILDSTSKVAAAVGVSYGFIHVEFLIESATNKPWFLEIANRGGGVHISNRIIPAITGVDIVGKLIDMATGRDAALGWDKQIRKKSLMYFVNPSGSASPEDIISQYPGRILALYMQRDSEHRDIQTQGAAGRKGVILLEGDDHGEMYKLAHQIEKNVSASKNEFYWGRPL